MLLCSGAIVLSRDADLISCDLIFGFARVVGRLLALIIVTHHFNTLNFVKRTFKSESFELLYSPTSMIIK